MKIRLLLLLSVCLHWIASPANGQGTVTVNGGGYAESDLWGTIPQASVGTFEGLTDVEIMEGAQDPNYSLMPRWRNFTPWVEAGDQGGLIWIPEIPPTRFN